MNLVILNLLICKQQGVSFKQNLIPGEELMAPGMFHPSTPHLPEPQPHSLFPRSASKGSHLGTSPLAPSHGASDANLSLEDTLVNLWIHSKRSWGEAGGAWGTAGNWIQIIHRLLFGVFVRVPRITQHWPPERWLYVITRGWGFQGPRGVCFESLRCPGCCAISCHQCLL